MAPTARQIAAIRRYTEGAYVNINRCLRRDDSGDPQNYTDAHLIEAAIRDATCAHPLVLYRGIDRDYADALERAGVRSGTVIEEPGICSTSSDPVQARPFRRGKGGMLLRICVDAGGAVLAIDKYSANPDELEWLLPPGTKMIVTGYDEDEDCLELRIMGL